jgi:hypothetical protein
MRAFLGLFLALFTLGCYADALDELYRAAGWPEQRAHFHDALTAAQQRYRSTLPPGVYQALVDNSNRRFDGAAMDRRALAAFRQQLPQPQPALAFFGSPLGRKIVAAELLATRADQLARYADGLPKVQASSTRQLLVGHLARAIPASEAGAEVSLALAGVAADSLSQMLPGLLGAGQAQSLLESQRQRLEQQVAVDLDNTLLYVYRDLSDPELDEFVTFAESADGQAYYRAALAALRAGLAVGQDSANLGN